MPGSKRMMGSAGVEPARDLLSGAAARGSAPGDDVVVPMHPGRYRLRQDPTGPVLTCVEAPTVSVRIRRGFCVTAAAARSAPPGSVFLDGAAQGAPFVDPKREVYNLDHHEGCVRAFTLATCEQAMVLIRKGLDLRRRDWTVHANDADLDTVLAIWVLLNHIRLNDRTAATRARVMPLLRLQGVIDALGLELQDLCALPAELLAETQAWVERLRRPELAAKGRGRWRDLDLLEHTAALLRTIDRLVYPPRQFDDLEDIEELVRVEIADGRVAIVCRSKVGIYEVERELRRLHGKRLGVIALQHGIAAYTLRQVDPYLSATLTEAYERLNLLDPAAGGHRSANRWGGSAEIGGSPRSTGTRATPQEIARACQQAFGTPPVRRRLSRIAAAALGSAAVIIATLACMSAWRWPGDRIVAASALATRDTSQFSVLLAILSGGLLLAAGVRTPGLYGLRPPARWDWCRLFPVAVLGALAGGAWIPAVALPTPATPLPGIRELLALFLLPLAGEAIFRGLVHGSLARTFPIQSCGGRWFVSSPAVVSAALYALWGAVLRSPAISVTLAMPRDSNPVVPALGAFTFGLAASMARERSESIATSVLLHWLSVLFILLGAWA